MKFFCPLKIFIFSLFFLNSLYSQDRIIKVNNERINKNLIKLSEFGINSNKGNDRLAYSDYDISARKHLINYLKEIGTQVNIDYAGNIIALRKGRKNN